MADSEVVESFDARTGLAQWRHAYPTTYRDDFGFDEGPRAVPVVASGLVFTFGAEGRLHAIDLATGKPLWNVDAMRQFGVPKGFFGAAGSPLIEDGRVIANVGGKNAGIVAFDAKTGKVLWTCHVPRGELLVGNRRDDSGQALCRVPDARGSGGP